MEFYILAINPGSTSTKTAVYRDETALFVENVPHGMEELAVFPSIMEQYPFRRKTVLAAMESHDLSVDMLSAVVGRGGMLPSVKGGGYLVNEEMLEELRHGGVRSHASNLGAVLAHGIAGQLQIPAYIYDAVTADELDDVAKITGIPEVTRRSFCHVLNAKATARKVAVQMGAAYAQKNFIVAHIGGGISISAHRKGRIVDIISDDAGPFSPERAGSVPLGYIIDICYNSGLSQEELGRKLNKNSGIKGHLGTNDCREVERRIAGGDRAAARIYEAQAYQIAKGIGEMAPVLCGEIDAVILTGGMAHSAYLTGEIERRCGYLGRIVTVPGENEMEALALGTLRILRGQEQASVYRKILD